MNARSKPERTPGLESDGTRLLLNLAEDVPDMAPVVREQLRSLAEALSVIEQNDRRYRWLRDCLWWRNDPFEADVGNMRQGYFQSKLFKRPEGPCNIDLIIDTALAAVEGKA